MLKFPNGKINLGLSVESRRTDGFHDVSTILYPIEMSDILEVISSADGKFKMNITGLEIPGSLNSNLVAKAYNLLRAQFDLPPVNIHLHKIIPTGAGLGGGSSDGAQMLQLCNQFFSLGLTNKQLQGYARKLGSDCAFFIENTPVLATGKGDQLKPVNIDLNAYHLMLVKPAVNISTADAYSWITPVKKAKSLLSIIEQSPDLWRDQLINDFEAPVFSKHPEIKKIKNQMYELGAVYASMTGTGAAVYGIFKQQPDPRSLFRDLSIWPGNITCV